VFGFFLLAIATRYYYGVVALLFLIDREPLKNRFMLIMGAMLFLATALDFCYFELNDSDSFMYNILIGVEMAVVIMVMGSWLLFNPSLLDLSEDPRLPKHVAASLGVTTAEVVLASPAKVGKSRLEQRGDPAETVTVRDGPIVLPEADTKPDPVVAAEPEAKDGDAEPD
jgi:hypothetical protein